MEKPTAYTTQMNKIVVRMGYKSMYSAFLKGEMIALHDPQSIALLILASRNNSTLCSIILYRGLLV